MLYYVVALLCCMVKLIQKKSSCVRMFFYFIGVTFACQDPLILPTFTYYQSDFFLWPRHLKGYLYSLTKPEILYS